MAFSQYFPEHS